MIHMLPDEKIVMVLRKHWIAIIGKVIIYIFAIFVPFITVPALSTAGFFLQVGPTIFFFIIYLMIVSLGMFITWIEFYLDIWIITTKRIIDINQRGLFNREVSEFMLQNVQDVTIDIPGMLATFLKFGNITIQTAGETSFVISQVSHVYEAKNAILDYSQVERKK